MQQAQFVSVISVENVIIARRSSSHPNYLNSQMPNIDVINLELDNFGSKKSFHIDVKFKNNSAYPIVQIRVHPWKRTNDWAAEDYGMNLLIDQGIYIANDDTACFRFIVPCDMFDQNKSYGLQISIDFINLFDFRTSATLYIEDLNSKGLPVKYSYRLSKFVDVKPKKI